jgi:hypothetical protein
VLWSLCGIVANNSPDGTPKNHENALVGLAVIGRRLEEEKVTAMMDVITKCLEINKLASMYYER